MEGRAHHTGLRLAVETSVFVLLMGAWLWGIVALGAHATVTQGPSTSHGGGLSGRVVLSCPAVPDGPEEGVGGEVCRPESRPHAGTSRQPGRGLPGGHVRGTVGRITNEPLSD